MVGEGVRGLVDSIFIFFWHFIALYPVNSKEAALA